MLREESGRSCLDLFVGASVLGYGHDPPELKAALLEYWSGDGVTHGLDTNTTARPRLPGAVRDLVAVPRGLDHRVQFPGPGGANAVEAALKLAREITGRHAVAYFDRGFHGMTLGSLAVTADQARRAGAGVPLPFDDPAQDEERAVAELLPPLTMTDEQLVHGLDTLDTAVASVAGVWTSAA